MRVRSDPSDNVPAPPIDEVAVLEAAAFVPGLGETAGAHLAAHTASGGWQLVELVGDGSVPGVSYISNEYNLRSLSVRPGPMNRPLYVLEVNQRENDGDYGSNVLEYVSSDSLWVCGSVDGAPRCAGVMTLSTSGLDKMLDDGDEPDPAEWGPLGEHTWSLGAKLEGSALQLAPTGEFPEYHKEFQSLAGNYSLEQFLDAPWTKHQHLR